jgi:hypothetical protein
MGVGSVQARILELFSELRRITNQVGAGEP